MATKTITIDLDAYARLKRARKANESFNMTIKRVVKPPIDVEAWLRRIRRNPLRRKTADAVERQVAQRRTGCARER